MKHLTHIRTSGSIMRSSPYLINRLLRGIDFGRTPAIVQLGVGTGCITREILRRLRPDGVLLAVEVNESWVEECTSIRDSRLELRHECASELPRLLAELGIDQVDYIVSTVPLAILPRELVDRILAASQASLSPDGKFLQYQYSLTNLFALERRFRDVRLGFTLRNVPPAFVYECSQRERRVSLAWPRTAGKRM